jgi:hypothetical protein
MTNRYLMSVAAAALIAGTGFANAQGSSTNREAPSSGAATQQTAPPSAATPMNRDSSQSGAPAEAPKSAQSKDKAGAKGEKSAQDNNMKGEKGAAGKDMKADSKTGNMDSKSGATNAQTKGSDTNNTNAQNKGGATGSQATTGNAATSATAAPPAEKRSQIASAIKSERIQETTNVNFNVAVGATIPASVHFYPLPPRIVEIYPEWRGYEVVLVHGRYVIVRPQTHEIVYIIEG